MANGQWPKHFIRDQQFLKGTNLADLASKKSKWQPCNIPNPLTHLLEQAWATSGPRATYGTLLWPASDIRSLIINSYVDY